MAEDDEHDLEELAKRVVVENEHIEATEREFSTRRRRLHMRIDHLRAHGSADGTPATPEQLAALEAEERQLSAARRALHIQIDEMRRKRAARG